MNTSDIVIYEADGGLQVKPGRETMWLTQKPTSRIWP